MAQTYCTGPCGVWCGVGVGNAAVFLGHCEAGVHINTIYAYDPVMNDLTGTKLPYDDQFMGQEAYISGIGPFTRWNEACFAAIENRCTGGTRGAEAFGVRGGFVIGESQAFTVWLAFPYSALAIFNLTINGAMENGRRYFQCKLADNQSDNGTRHMRRHLAFHAKSVISMPAMTHSLWDYNLTGIVGAPVS